MFYRAECNFASLLCPKSTRNDDEKLQIEGKNSDENNQNKKSDGKIQMKKI